MRLDQLAALSGVGEGGSFVVDLVVDEKEGEVVAFDWIVTF